MLCRYCRTDVQPEYDPESGRDYFPDSHFDCVHEQASGRWVVVTVQHAASPASTHVRSYGSRLRAVEEARFLRLWNQRDWPCGAELDIVVRPAPWFAMELRTAGHVVPGERVF